MSHAGVSWYRLEPKKAEEELSEENGAEAILDSRNTLTLDIYVKARLDAFGHTLRPLISFFRKWVDCCSKHDPFFGMWKPLNFFCCTHSCPLRNLAFMTDLHAFMPVRQTRCILIISTVIIIIIIR